MAPVRVRRAADNHRQLRGAGPRGAPAPRRQDAARPEAGKDGGLLPGHLLRRGLAQDPRARVRHAQTLLPQEHLEHNGFFRRSHGIHHIIPAEGARSRSANVTGYPCVTAPQISVWNS
uniref:(northern house mosquito) hypothetical protein n=1 Tax=Culex pipiens TaxID=7175 RepID=A0A8D8NZG0_CULPI